MMAHVMAEIAALRRAIAGLTRRQTSHVSFARSTAAPNDSGSAQTSQVQLDALTLRDGVPVLMNFGFTSNMPPGGDNVVVHLGGERSKAIVIATGHQQYRLTGLPSGAVAIHDSTGNKIVITSTGIAITGNVAITGNLTVTGDITAGLGSADQVGVRTHRHNTSAGGGPSAAPTAGT